MNENDKYVKSRLLVRAAKQAQLAHLFRQRNVIGMAFGKRLVGGKATDEYAAVVYVMKKTQRTFIPSTLLIPRKVYIGGDAIEVDVVETGPVYPLSFTAKERPAPSGISIGHSAVTAGTLGCLVRDRTDGSTCILSNNHVLAAENAGMPGDAIVQPGIADGGMVGPDNIGTLKRFVNLMGPGAGNNIVDAAIAGVTNAADVVNQMKNNLMPAPNADHPAVGLLFAGSCNRTWMNPIADVLAQLNIEMLGGAQAVSRADLAMNVEKVGRTTEYTTSTVMEIDATINISYPNIGTLTFERQITTAWMSDPGDSGSIVCRGGEGGNDDHCGCASASAAASLLGRNVKIDTSLEKEFRESHLAQTLVGRYLITTYFANEDMIIDRVRAARITKEDRAYAQAAYDKNISRLRKIAIDPNANEDRVQKGDMDEIISGIERLKPYLKKDEQAAADQVRDILKSFDGKSAREILHSLNDPGLHNRIVKIVSSVSSLKKPCCC
ncbi:hypothetical protein EON80_00415 [bacterium]|nr:MAG: hypothetical protein EON80_00415 [bacterium]